MVVIRKKGDYILTIPMQLHSWIPKKNGWFSASSLPENPLLSLLQRAASLEKSITSYP